MELDEAVSEGTRVGENVYLGGRIGAVDVCVGDSGGVSGSACLFGVYLQRSAGALRNEDFAAHCETLVLFPNSPTSCLYPFTFLKPPLSGRGVIEPLVPLVVLVNGRLFAPAPAPAAFPAFRSLFDADALANIDCIMSPSGRSCCIVSQFNGVGRLDIEH